MVMRVLAICYEDPEEILGGMGMHVREIYRALAKNGVDVDLVTSSTLDGSKDYLGFRKHHDDKLICWKPRRPDISCRYINDIQVAKALTRLIADRLRAGGDWDVIHMHEWTSVQLGRLCQNALGLPLVGTMHLCISYLSMISDPASNPASWGEADLYMMQQEGNLVCDPDEFILCSNAYVDIVRKHFLVERPINMIYNGIDTELWNPDAGDGERSVYDHSLHFSQGFPVPGRLIALFVGRIAEMKGITYLLDALEYADPGWQVVLAGEVNANTEEDKDRWEVTKRIKALESAHPERLRWVGFQHGQALRDLYAAADCVLMPSTHEPFGIVALEAMAMGCPLIATEVDGLGEIVCDGEDEYAMIIPAESPEAILAALKVLRRSTVRAELRALGLRRVRDFTWDVAADKTLEVYERAVRRRRDACPAEESNRAAAR